MFSHLADGVHLQLNHIFIRIAATGLFMCHSEMFQPLDLCFFLALIFFTDTLSIVPCAMAVAKVKVALKMQKISLKKLQAHQAYSINTISIILKLLAPYSSVFPIRICLFSLIILELSNVSFRYYCDSVFLFILPVNVISSTICACVY